MARLTSMYIYYIWYVVLNLTSFQSALQAAIEELDHTEMGVDGVPSMNSEEDRENDRKLREEKLISSMEEQMNKIHSVESSPQKASPTTDLKSRLQPPRLRELQTNILVSTIHGY